MARTPILRAIQRMAREQKQAAHLGIEVEELRDREYTRREVLRRGGVAGAGLALGGALATAASARAARSTSARIAIVGGGIAGLTAALPLQDNASLRRSSRRRPHRRPHALRP